MDEVPWLNADEERAWRSYRRMRTLLDLHLARDLLSDSGLSEADYDVLSTLSERTGGEWRPSELAARLLWSTSRLAHHVGRMERRGLITRGSCPDDKRGAAVALTHEGWQALRQAAPEHVRSVRRHLVDLLTPAEIDALAVISSKVIDHFADAVAQDRLTSGTSSHP
ncbi:MAG TPA: MarR family transcriptional regulator [Streptosporangiaceae bacterium]